MEWFAPNEPISAWTHGLWMLLAIPAGAFLVWKNRGDGARVIGMTVFSVSLVICFGASSLYHAAPTGPMRNILHVLDYLGIYLLIAGTVTPVALIVLRGWWRRWLLVQIWLLAAAGCVHDVLRGDGLGGHPHLFRVGASLISRRRMAVMDGRPLLHHRRGAGSLALAEPVAGHVRPP
jgi:predicted membrane channel-forming protein YqfA (hemolysin III family)